MEAVRVMSRVRAQAVEVACRVMHDSYEAAAAKVGWETQERSRKPWEDVPEANRATMRAAVGALLDHLDTDREQDSRQEWELDDRIVDAVATLRVRTGLQEATIADLLNSGWTYVERIDMVPRWEHPAGRLPPISIPTPSTPEMEMG